MRVVIYNSEWFYINVSGLQIGYDWDDTTCEIFDTADLLIIEVDENQVH